MNGRAHPNIWAVRILCLASAVRHCYSRQFIPVGHVAAHSDVLPAEKCSIKTGLGCPVNYNGERVYYNGTSGGRGRWPVMKMTLEKEKKQAGLSSAKLRTSLIGLAAKYQVQDNYKLHKKNQLPKLFNQLLKMLKYLFKLCCLNFV